MPYTVPTTDQFYERFPIFENYDEDALTAILAEAAAQIDNSWREQDYQPAIMYLAAHMIALDNSQAGEEVQIGEPGTISSESFAGMSVSYASTPQASGVSTSGYAATSYGRRYYQLLIKNKPGVVVA
jgi:hypothetical protein